MFARTNETAADEYVIEIPANLSFGDSTFDTYGNWNIRYCFKKLQAKYGRYHSVEFDGYASARAACDSFWLQRIEAADLWMTRLMNSGYREIQVSNVIGNVKHINAALRAVPLDVGLEQDLTERDWQALENLLWCFSVEQVGLAKMTKVLCMKRPRLIPMLNSFVMKFLFRKEWPRGYNKYSTAGIVAMKQFRALMQQSKLANPAKVDNRDEWVVEQSVSRQTANRPYNGPDT